MNLKEIREEAWSRADDVPPNEADHLWSKDEMTSYANRIEELLARESKCIRDAFTAQCCLVLMPTIDYTTILPGSMDYVYVNDSKSPLFHKNVSANKFKLDPSVIEVDTVTLASTGTSLKPISFLNLAQFPLWDQVVAIPSRYSLDASPNSIVLDGRVSVDDSLYLTVARLPLKKMSVPSDMPEIPTEFHYAFLDGMLWQMYLKQDSESFDAERAKHHEVAFLNNASLIQIRMGRKKGPQTNSPRSGML